MLIAGTGTVVRVYYVEISRPAMDLKQLYRTLANRDEDSVYFFIHHPDRRRCDCLRYVCTAIKIGKFRNKLPTIKDTECCVICEKGLQVSRVCFLCKEVAYCQAILH